MKFSHFIFLGSPLEALREAAWLRRKERYRPGTRKNLLSCQTLFIQFALVYEVDLQTPRLDAPPVGKTFLPRPSEPSSTGRLRQPVWQTNTTPPHSLQRGGASFCFQAGVPLDHINGMARGHLRQSIAISYSSRRSRPQWRKRSDRRSPVHNSRFPSGQTNYQSFYHYGTMCRAKLPCFILAASARPQFCLLGQAYH